ncbi:hypothetical protein SCA6_012508 [Theobroma cacao]
MEGVNEKENEEVEAQKHSGPSELGKWAEIQDMLKKRVITEDDFPWRLPSLQSQHQQLRYVGGVDVSVSKEDPSMACGSLVVLDLHHALRLVYQCHTVLTLDVPYVPGFLAFREAPILVHLLEKMKSTASPFYPQPGFGLASHLGVLANLPTIGIGKNLHHVDGLTRSGVKELLEAEENRTKDLITLRGSSGFIWGVSTILCNIKMEKNGVENRQNGVTKAMRSTQSSLKPLFVSIGHRISLDTAIKVVKMTCKFRVPEPIRQN